MENAYYETIMHGFQTFCTQINLSSCSIFHEHLEFPLHFLPPPFIVAGIGKSSPFWAGQVMRRRTVLRGDWGPLPNRSASYSSAPSNSN